MTRLLVLAALISSPASAQSLDYLLQQNQNSIDARFTAQNQEWYQLQRLAIERERLALERERLRRDARAR